jgi:hypothetical protein
MMLLRKDHAVASKLDSQNAVNGSVDGENRSWDRMSRKSGWWSCADRWMIGALPLRHSGFRSARQSNLTEHDTLR